MLNSQVKYLLKYWLSEENQVANVVVLTTFTTLSLFMWTIDAHSSRLYLATTMLSLNYVILMILIISHSQLLKSLLRLNTIKTNSQPKILIARLLVWFDSHNIALTFVLIFSCILIFEKVYAVKLIYNLTIAFCFALTLYRVVLFIKARSQEQPQSLDFKSQKIYIIYASFICLSFFFSTTVDDSDYGTEFQLTILSWLMLFHLLFHWVIGQWELVKQLQNERTNAELMHLKSQVNPHFLFNTLNNLYGLALEKSDQTPSLILKLSDMLRYTIYQGKKEQVLLSEEVTYLNDFIQLQQIRYHKQVNITFDHAIEDSNLLISPLLLLILVENAYKHGVEKLIEKAFIVIKLEIKKCNMAFEIENNFDGDEQTIEPGIGLHNLTKRLKLMYPDSHQLKVTSEHGVYSVRLEMKLKNEHQI